MVTKQDIKVIKSLNQKKYRQQLGLFTVEGVKGINEFLDSDYQLHKLYTTTSCFDVPVASEVLITETDLKKISVLKSPNVAVAVFKIPSVKPVAKAGLIVALDAVRDPGNLGTIIRLCDWYGINDLVCSTTTVDCYNSKVVQATMGSLTRVNVSYLDLHTFISKSELPTFGTFMNGDAIYTTALPNQGIVVMGNEANGISSSVAKLLDAQLTIPRFGVVKKTESLNVANATAIVLSEFRRRSIEM